MLSFGLGRLRVSGNKIVSTAKGEPILLRGVNRSGLEHSEPDHDSFVSAAGMSGYEFHYIAYHWKANIFRIPFNQDWALNGRGSKTADDYLRDIDRVIGWAACQGAYTLLDLQWLDMDHSFGAGRQFVAPLPNPETPRLWKMLAQRYKDEPAVMFDLLNEPHDRADDDPYLLYKPDGSQYPADQRRVTMAEWKPWAELLIDTIRAEAPETLIFVSGTNWAYDLRGFPLQRSNVVYSTHIYPAKGRDWDGAFGDLSLVAPVFAGEIGGQAGDVRWGRKLLDYLTERGIGWTAWSMFDEPQLVQRFRPTEFGRVVAEQMGLR
ncbi:MAG: cellulase family glycosylhydrolase [Acidobacteriota bacterium]